MPEEPRLQKIPQIPHRRPCLKILERGSIHSQSARQTTAPVPPVPSVPVLAPDESSTIARASPAHSPCLPQSHTRAPNSDKPAQIPAPPGWIPQTSSSPLPPVPSANKGSPDYSAPPDTRAAPPAPAAGTHTHAQYHSSARIPSPARNLLPGLRDSKPARAPRFSEPRPTPSSAGTRSPDSAARPRGPG